MQILDGKKARQAYTGNLTKRINRLSFVPHLAIIQVGNRADSTAFIAAKKSFAKKIGVKETHLIFPEKISEKELIKKIQKINEDKKIQGIIIQLPLPNHINSSEVIDAIDPRKDVDGLTSINVKRWMTGNKKAVIPATTRGIKELFDFYNISLSGKKVTMVGRSSLVGKPTAMMCLNQNATVTICHSKTRSLEAETKRADILIVAIGRPNFINKKHVSRGQVVIDIGITRMSDGSLSGDVDFNKVKNIVAKITPVPGGVGQMTVLALFENLIDACYNANN